MNITHCITRLAIVVVVCMTLFHKQSFAQFGTNTQPQFGKITKQFNSFDWQTMQSRNFDIYFHNGGDTLARYASVMLEEFLVPLQRTMSYYINQKIAVILYNTPHEYNQTNAMTVLLPRGAGGVVELSKNKIIVPFEGSFADFRISLRHKLVHAFLNEMLFGGLIKTNVSTGVKVDLPMWLVEGVAEYFAYGGLTVETDTYLRERLLSEKHYSPSMLKGLELHKLGHAFFSYLATKSSIGKIGEIFGRLRTTGSVESAFKGAFGMGSEHLWSLWWKEMQQSVRQSKFPGENLSNSGKPLFDVKEELPQLYFPLYSPNGDKVVYYRLEGDNEAHLYLINLTEKEKISKRGAPTQVISKPVVSVRLSNAEHIANLGAILNFEGYATIKQRMSWNYNGSQLAVISSTARRDEIKIFDENGKFIQSYSPGFTSIIHCVAWSPDAKFIAFSATDAANTNIYLLDIATKKIVKITDDIFYETGLVWSNDSKMLFFTSDRGNHYFWKNVQKGFSLWSFEGNTNDIYSITLTNKVIKRITNEPLTKKHSIVCSPDNTSLFYISDKSGMNNVFQVTIDSKENAPKTNVNTTITAISATSKGDKLLVTTSDAGSSQVIVVQQPFSNKWKPKGDLVLTPFKKELAEREDVAQKTALLLDNALNDQNPIKKDSLVGYGQFDIDFSRQRMVYPDVEALNALNLSQKNTEQGVDGGNPGSLPVSPYKMSFINDFFMVNPAWDTFIQFYISAQALFTDIMGDHRLFLGANFLWNFDQSDLLASYSYNAGFIDLEFSLFRTARSFFLRGGQTDLSFWGAGFRGIYPLYEDTRLEVGLKFIRTAIGYNGLPTEVSRTLFVPDFRVVVDNSSGNGFFAPTSGGRGFIAVDGSPGIGENSPTFARITGDYRHYVTISNAVTLAMRAAGGVFMGNNPQKFIVGGMDNTLVNALLQSGDIPFETPEDLIFMVNGAPLRGFAIGAKSGNNYFVSNIEARVPILKALSAENTTGIIQNLFGTVFFDCGSAWTGRLQANLPEIVYDTNGNPTPPFYGDLLVSAGVGARAIFLGLPVKFDLAWLNVQGGWIGPHWTISLGFDF